jgi:hypothetical protein
MADYTVGIEFVAGSFTNVTADVLQLSINRTLASPANPLRPGSTNIQFRNDDGTYSPDNPNSAFAGLMRPDLQIKVQATDASSTRGLFLGTIDDWRVAPGFPSTATISGRDKVKQLREVTITTSLFQGYQVNSIFAEVFNAANVSSYNVDISDANAIPFVWFRDQRASDAIQELIESGYFFAFADGNGVFQVKDRYFDASGTVVCSHNQAYSMGYSLAIDDVFNDAIVEGRERQVVNSTQVLAEIVDAIAIPGQSHVNFSLEYFDPQNLAPAPGTSMVSPVSSTDYLANTSSDGSGSNATSTTSVAVTFYGQTAVNTIYNASANEVFLTKFQLRGNPVQRRPSISARAADVNSSQVVYGKKTYRVENRFLQGFDFTQNYATFLVDRNKDPVPEIPFTLVNELPAMLDINLGDLIHVTNSITGADRDWETRMSHSSA